MGWTSSNPTWAALTDAQKAAAMALMEAGLGNFDDAQHTAGAMVNRAMKSGQPLGAHVSQKIYQPTIEPAQEARLNKIIKSPQFGAMTEWVQMRTAGEIPDNVNGATHFLAHPKVMLDLEAKEPSKYKNWGPRGANWTGYDEKTGQYANQVFADGSHAFLAPEGTASAPGAPVQVASLATSPTPKGNAVDPLTLLMSLMGSGSAPVLAEAATAIAPAAGEAVAAAAPTIGTEAAPIAGGSPITAASAPGQLASAAGFPETGGYLDAIFGANQQSGGGGASASVDTGGSKESESKDPTAAINQNALAGIENMNKQTLAQIMQPRNPQVDMTRLAQILQRRATLGV